MCIEARLVSKVNPPTWPPLLEAKPSPRAFVLKPATSEIECKISNIQLLDSVTHLDEPRSNHARRLQEASHLKICESPLLRSEVVSMSIPKTRERLANYAWRSRLSYFVTCSPYSLLPHSDTDYCYILIRPLVKIYEK